MKTICVFQRKVVIVGRCNSMTDRLYISITGGLCLTVATPVSLILTAIVT